MTLRIPKRWLGPHWLRDVFYAIAYLSIFLRQRILPSRQPAILILADSISRGRLPWLRQVFAGQYHVCGPFENGQSTAFSLRRIGLWLSMRRRWVMVVCNWGLHDIRRNGGGPVAVPVEAYAANLRHLITRICRRSDHCLFVTTTPVPPEAPLWHPADVERYNAAARTVMAELRVPLCDTFEAAHAIHAAEGKPPRRRNIHYTAEGYRRLAALVEDAMRAELRGASVKDAPHRAESR